MLLKSAEIDGTPPCLRGCSGGSRTPELDSLVDPSSSIIAWNRASVVRDWFESLTCYINEVLLQNG